MKRFSQQFNKKAKDILLSVAEKRELRERIVSYMEYHPLPNAHKMESVMISGQQEHFISLHFNKWRILRWSGSMVLILIFSISYMAEKAIPGDALYSIKVGFNEELRSTMARGSYEKVVWETERLNRRIAEAQLLADAGRLTHEAEIEVASAIQEHTDNARREIENLKLSDKDEAALASISLTTALDIQSVSLDRRDDNNQAEGTAQSTDLIKAVLTQTQNAELLAQDNELPAYDKLIAKVESETTRAHELLKGVTAYATTVEQDDIQKRLDDINKRIATAMATAESDQVAAKHDLVNALQQTHRLIVFMTNIDVRANVTVEDLVPNTLTTEERFAALNSRVQETDKLIERVEYSLSTSTATTFDEAVVAKVLPALEKSKITIANLKEMLLASDESQLETMETLALDAYSLINDTVTLLKLDGENTPVESVPETPVEAEVEVEVNEESTELENATTTETPLEV